MFTVDRITHDGRHAAYFSPFFDLLIKFKSKVDI